MVISWLKSQPASLEVADLGCGDATLSARVAQKVYNFDLVASAPNVIACNMAKLPLAEASVDVAVFCLSLMGTDYGSFLREAARILRPKGFLWIAEVQSRFIDEHGDGVLEEFVAGVEGLGFSLRHRDTKNSHFLTLRFQETRESEKGSFSKYKWPVLRACQYKKR
jgi:ribosomal RNA-processing protein 8